MTTTEKRELRYVVRTAMGTDRKHPEYLAFQIHFREAGVSACNKYGICTSVVYGNRDEDIPIHSSLAGVWGCNSR